MRPFLAAICALCCAGAVLVRGAAAQSLLDRPPTLSGDWVGTSGTMYFNFLHRFTASAAPERKVANVPTFTLAVGLPARTLLGAHYATNSNLAPRYPNEWEFFARHLVFSQEAGLPLDVGAQVGYNLAADGVDGEVTLARRQGALRLIAAARVLSDPLEAGKTRFAGAAGATVRATRYVAVAGDVATLAERRAGEEVAWSGGVHLALPYTPHTLSLHASNTAATTLQGASRGGETVRYGFEFTVPVTLRRWLGGGGAVPTAPPPPAAPSHAGGGVAGGAPEGGPPVEDVVGAGEEVVEAGMRGFAYLPPRLEVVSGTTVEWTNRDAVPHTVTSPDGVFDSGLIQPGARWRHTFSRPGTYSFHCTPHPFMKGTVAVREP